MSKKDLRNVKLGQTKCSLFFAIHTWDRCVRGSILRGEVRGSILRGKHGGPGWKGGRFFLLDRTGHANSPESATVQLIKSKVFHI